MVMNKPLRQRAILELVDRGPVHSQEDLQRVLNRRGFDVGQATLSRDIRDLGLVKTSEGYALPQGETSGDATLPPASRTSIAWPGKAGPQATKVRAASPGSAARANGFCR